MSLCAEAITAQLTTMRYGRSLQLLAATGSTNDDAKAQASQLPSGHVVAADAQHGGRGSHGRQWLSPPGQDLYLSIVDRPAVAFAALPPLTLAIGLGVAEAVDQVLAETAKPSPGSMTTAKVKWPNDVWLGGKKCAGILVEAISFGDTLDAVVIGIGLNVNRDVFPDELSSIATSLRAHTATAYDRNHVLCVLLASVERWVERFVTEGPKVVATALQARLAMLGERAHCGELRGTVLGVADSGALRLRTSAGVQELIAGRLLPDP